jgi:hypothetical protein
MVLTNFTTPGLGGVGACSKEPRIDTEHLLVAIKGRSGNLKLVVGTLKA